MTGLLGVAAAGGWGTATVMLGALLRRRGEASRAREAVIRAAHELRGALSTVSLATDTARLDAGRRRAIAVGIERARLALADLEDDRPRAPTLECFDARRLLNDCVLAARGLAAAQGTSLVDRWDGAPSLVVGERARLAGALANLIANAIEHGGPRVTVRGRATEGVVRIEVCDDGPGLPATLAVMSGRPHPGRPQRGRGLAIAADAARRHRGRLAIAPPGAGARIALVVPAAGARRGEADAPGGPPRSPSSGLPGAGGSGCGSGSGSGSGPDSGSGSGCASGAGSGAGSGPGAGSSSGCASGSGSGSESPG